MGASCAPGASAARMDLNDGMKLADTAAMKKLPT
jgi:hypothetical protein